MPSSAGRGEQPPRRRLVLGVGDRGPAGRRVPASRRRCCPARARRRSARRRRAPSRPAGAAAPSAARCPRPARRPAGCRRAARPAGRAARPWSRTSRAAAPRRAGGRCPAQRNAAVRCPRRPAAVCPPAPTPGRPRSSALRGDPVQLLQHRDRRLTAHARGHDRHERRHRQLGLVQPCPSPRSSRWSAPARRGTRPMEVGQRGQRALVEPDDRVAEVVVVEQDQVRLRQARRAPAPAVRAPATSTSTRCVRTSAPPLRPGCTGRSRCGAAAASGARPAPPAARRTR